MNQPAGKPIIAWSYSAITSFENCPYKFWATKIGRIVSDVNQYNAKGDLEHQYFENYLKKGIVLPPEAAPFAPLLDKLKALPGQKYYEYQMTLDANFVPCRWKDYDRAYVRAAADFLHVHDDRAHYFDWKSGKVRKDDEQIELTALMVFKHFPQVQQLNAGLVFYRQNKLHPHIVRRSDEALLWNGWIGRVRELERAVREDSWPKTPNPLCAWCPVLQCPYNRQEERLKREAAARA